MSSMKGPTYTFTEPRPINQGADAICVHCETPRKDHVGDKCLFDATAFTAMTMAEWLEWDRRSGRGILGAIEENAVKDMQAADDAEIARIWASRRPRRSTTASPASSPAGTSGASPAPTATSSPSPSKTSPAASRTTSAPTTPSSPPGSRGPTPTPAPVPRGAATT